MPDLPVIIASEKARLVLGYLKEERYDQTYATFLAECPSLAEYADLQRRDLPCSLEVWNQTLSQILSRYAALRLWNVLPFDITTFSDEQWAETSRILFQLNCVFHRHEQQHQQKQEKYQSSLDFGLHAPPLLPGPATSAAAVSAKSVRAPGGVRVCYPGMRNNATTTPMIPRTKEERLMRTGRVAHMQTEQLTNATISVPNPPNVQTPMKTDNSSTMMHASRDIIRSPRRKCIEPRKLKSDHRGAEKGNRGVEKGNKKVPMEFAERVAEMINQNMMMAATSSTPQPASSSVPAPPESQQPQSQHPQPDMPDFDAIFNNNRPISPSAMSNMVSGVYGDPDLNSFFSSLLAPAVSPALGTDDPSATSDPLNDSQNTSLNTTVNSTAEGDVQQTAQGSMFQESPSVGLESTDNGKQTSDRTILLPGGTLVQLPDSVVDSMPHIEKLMDLEMKHGAEATRQSIHSDPSLGVVVDGGEHITPSITITPLKGPDSSDAPNDSGTDATTETTTTTNAAKNAVEEDKENSSNRRKKAASKPKKIPQREQKKIESMRRKNLCIPSMLEEVFDSEAEEEKKPKRAQKSTKKTPKRKKSSKEEVESVSSPGTHIRSLFVGEEKVEQNTRAENEEVLERAGLLTTTSPPPPGILPSEDLKAYAENVQKTPCKTPKKAVTSGENVVEACEVFVPDSQETQDTSMLLDKNEANEESILEDGDAQVTVVAESQMFAKDDKNDDDVSTSSKEVNNNSQNKKKQVQEEEAENKTSHRRSSSRKAKTEAVKKLTTDKKEKAAVKSDSKKGKVDRAKKKKVDIEECIVEKKVRSRRTPKKYTELETSSDEDDDNDNVGDNRSQNTSVLSPRKTPVLSPQIADSCDQIIAIISNNDEDTVTETEGVDDLKKDKLDETKQKKVRDISVKQELHTELDKGVQTKIESRLPMKKEMLQRVAVEEEERYFTDVSTDDALGTQISDICDALVGHSKSEIIGTVSEVNVKRERSEHLDRKDTELEHVIDSRDDSGSHESLALRLEMSNEGSAFALALPFAQTDSILEDDSSSQVFPLTQVAPKKPKKAKKEKKGIRKEEKRIEKEKLKEMKKELKVKKEKHLKDAKKKKKIKERKEEGGASLLNEISAVNVSLEESGHKKKKKKSKELEEIDNRQDLSVEDSGEKKKKSNKKKDKKEKDKDKEKNELDKEGKKKKKKRRSKDDEDEEIQEKSRSEIIIRDISEGQDGEADITVIQNESSMTGPSASIGDGSVTESKDKSHKSKSKHKEKGKRLSDILDKLGEKVTESKMVVEDSDSLSQSILSSSTAKTEPELRSPVKASSSAVREAKTPIKASDKAAASNTPKVHKHGGSIVVPFTSLKSYLAKQNKSSEKSNESLVDEKLDSTITPPVEVEESEESSSDDEEEESSSDEEEEEEEVEKSLAGVKTGSGERLSKTGNVDQLTKTGSGHQLASASPSPEDASSFLLSLSAMAAKKLAKHEAKRKLKLQNRKSLGDKTPKQKGTKSAPVTPNSRLSALILLSKEEAKKTESDNTPEQSAKKRKKSTDHAASKRKRRLSLKESLADVDDSALEDLLDQVHSTPQPT